MKKLILILSVFAITLNVYTQTQPTGEYRGKVRVIWLTDTIDIDPDNVSIDASGQLNIKPDLLLNDGNSNATIDVTDDYYLIIENNTNGDNYAAFGGPDDKVILYYEGDQKLTTVQNGVTVSDTLYLTGTGATGARVYMKSGELTLWDNTNGEQSISALGKSDYDYLKTDSIFTNSTSNIVIDSVKTTNTGGYNSYNWIKSGSDDMIDVTLSGGRLMLVNNSSTGDAFRVINTNQGACFSGSASTNGTGKVLSATCGDGAEGVVINNTGTGYSIILQDDGSGVVYVDSTGNFYIQGLHTNDTIKVGQSGWSDEGRIFVDGSGNMIFKDDVTSEKTLAELAEGGGADYSGLDDNGLMFYNASGDTAETNSNITVLGDTLISTYATLDTVNQETYFKKDGTFEEKLILSINSRIEWPNSSIHQITSDELRLSCDGGSYSVKNSYFGATITNGPLLRRANQSSTSPGFCNYGTYNSGFSSDEDSCFLISKSEPKIKTDDNGTYFLDSIKLNYLNLSSSDTVVLLAIGSTEKIDTASLATAAWMLSEKLEYKSASKYLDMIYEKEVPELDWPYYQGDIKRKPANINAMYAYQQFQAEIERQLIYISKLEKRLRNNMFLIYVLFTTFLIMLIKIKK